MAIAVPVEVGRHEGDSHNKEETTMPLSVKEIPMGMWIGPVMEVVTLG